MLQGRDVYSFSGETGMTPLEVLQQANIDLLDWKGKGIGVMEMSHRSQDYAEINDKANQDLRELLSVPQNYKILFMQGGASLQYSAIPMNILQENNISNYLISGDSSYRAAEENKKYGEPTIVAPIERNYNQLPPLTEWKVNKDGAYFYYTDNETIDGLEFKTTPSITGMDLVSDMSSSLGTKQIDISKHAVIIASAQKNLGSAGVTIVIVREDLIGKHRAYTPSMFSWKTTLDTASIFNTAPCVAVYMTGQYVNYLKRTGGVSYYQDLAEKRSKMIYDVIDSSHGFYYGKVSNKEDRSRLNAVFYIKENNTQLQDEFITKAAKNGLIELRGHETTGGIRASMFNCMPLQGIQKLRDFMEEFIEQN